MKLEGSQPSQLLYSLFLSANRVAAATHVIVLSSTKCGRVACLRPSGNTATP
jgi:hypothetical protein